VGPTSHQLALHLIDWLAVSSIHPLCRRFTCGVINSPRYVVNAPVVSSMHLSCHRFTCRVIDWPTVSSMGSLCCRSAYHPVDWATVCSICPPSPQFVRCLVDSHAVPSIRMLSRRFASVSSIRTLSHRFACCLVDSPAILSMGSLRCRLACRLRIRPSSCRLANRDLDSPAMLVIDPPCGHSVLLGCSSCRGRRIRWSVATREEERARTSHDKKSWFVLVTHRASHFIGPPLCVLLPFACSSFERDGDRPTSLRTGEGHWVGFSSVVGSELGRRRDDGGGGRREELAIDTVDA